MSRNLCIARLNKFRSERISPKHCSEKVGTNTNFDCLSLDTLAEDGKPVGEEEAQDGETEGDVTPTADRSYHKRLNTSKNKPTVHDAVVEVVLSSADIDSSCFAGGMPAATGPGKHVFAKMIITIWEIEDERYFTLTFTNSDSDQKSLPSSKGQSRQVAKVPRRPKALGSNDSGSRGSRSSMSSGQNSNQGSNSNSSLTSPTMASMSASPFPPLGPPSRTATATATTPSVLQKIIMMKDALMDNTEVPIVAMWKDESLAIPNKAARRLFHKSSDTVHVTDGMDLISKWELWDEAFTAVLDPSEYPIAVLIKTQTTFASRRVGIYDPDDGRPIVLDCSGDAMTDENGEFLAGILTCKDITGLTKEIGQILEKNEQQFQVICDSLPQMLWTTDADGEHDWFSERW